MKKIFTFAFATLFAFSLLFTAPSIFASTNDDIRVDEAKVESGEGKSPTLIITGDFPTSAPLDVSLISGGMTRATFRKYSNDGRTITVPLEGVQDADSANLQVMVSRAGRHTGY